MPYGRTEKKSFIFSAVRRSPIREEFWHPSWIIASLQNDLFCTRSYPFRRRAGGGENGTPKEPLRIENFPAAFKVYVNGKHIFRKKEAASVPCGILSKDGCGGASLIRRMRYQSRYKELPDSCQYIDVPLQKKKKRPLR